MIFVFLQIEKFKKQWQKIFNLFEFEFLFPNT